MSTKLGNQKITKDLRMGFMLWCQGPLEYNKVKKGGKVSKWT